jgi:hypothetical protein
MKMPFDTESSPVLQFIQDIMLGGTGLEAQGITGEINGVLSVDLREIETLPEGTQGIRPVRLESEFKGILEHGCTASGNLPTFGTARLLHLTDSAK